jgi:hypothetical protein
MDMPANIERSRSGKPTLVKRGVAALLVVVVGVLAIHFIVGLVMTVFWVIVAIAAIAAILWAANTLL